jgi:hypothetical protein
MWFEVHLAQVSAHRNNIVRYRAILNSRLTPLEQAFVERRIAEEEAALQSLSRIATPSRAPSDRGADAPSTANRSMHRSIRNV